jgi:hypothetical protein
MAQDKVSGTRVGKFYDREAIPGVRFDTATQLGIVKDNLSPARDGRLRVWIPDFGGDENNPQFWVTVNSSSPYAGSTYQPQSSVNNNFTGTNHSYGMWMVPPDIGNWVLCTFVNGDPERGFWFACVPNTLSRYMTPALAAGNKIDRTTVSDAIKASILPENNVPPQYLPVSEFNENMPDNVTGTFYNNAKPVHEFQANILFKQGLDRDKTRGAISSNAQRETPSHVFGISTPGRALTKDPADDPGYAEKVATGGIPADQYAVPNRKGGHSFIMDDGDVNGVDQLIRLRTAGGHQLLMNDDQKVIYVGHKDGTSWVEIDDYGIKIYTAGNMSVRSEGVLNIHSDKDINVNADNNFNINAGGSFNVTSAQVNIGGTESLLMYGAKTNIGAGQITVSSDGKLNVSSGAAMTLSGSTIDINGGSGGNSITCPVLQKNKLADTTFDSDKTKLWYSVPQSIDSIVTILPSHEPWPRPTDGGPAPLTKAVSSSVCPPKMGAPVTDYVLPPPNGNKSDKGKVKGQTAPWTTDTAFITKVQSVASALNLNYIDLLACMNLETGRTFDPAITNSLGYTGLIQFGTPAATLCGTTTASLREMDRVTQCDYVQKYFIGNRLAQKAPNPRLVDLYLTILWPAAVGRPDDYVVFPAGSREYNANPGFDPGKKVGYITVGMIADQIAIHQAEVKQALANAGTGTQPAGVVTSGSGTVITDGSGNPVRSGTTSASAANTTDVGITNAAGKAVSGDTCPAEYLVKTTTYNPSKGIGDNTPKFDQKQTKAMMAELGYFESKFDYSKVSSDGTRIGKYQVDAAYLADAGYIKPDAVKQYGAGTLANKNSWTGRDSIQSQDDFFTNQVIQDTIQFNEFTTNYTALFANKGIVDTDDICTAAGMLFVAHQFRSANKAKEWRDKGALVDALNQPGEIYYNQGRYAIDILAAGGAAQTTAQAAGVSATGAATENTSGINPDDVFSFSGSGTGTRSNFDALGTTFKSAVLKMAQEFKTKTGSKITISSAYRSTADQQALIDRWHAAGGGPNNPTAGGITTPSLKHSAHNDGMAIDSGQMSLVARTVDLAQYGLRWGGTFTKPDAVHIQLMSATLQ